jgi:endonuclease/exonuclease/phosphatase family metal-dependent hydrolase
MNVFKKVLHVIAILAVLVSCEKGKEMPVEYFPPPPSPSPDKETVNPSELPCDFNVMTFNVRYPASSDKGEKAWSSRRKAVYAMIKDRKPMIIGVQECYLSQRADILANCSDYKAYGVGRDDGKEKGESMSILYDSKKVQLENSGTFWLSPTPDKPSKGWDAACNRTATWEIVKIIATGKRFFLVNTHLDHVSSTAREEGIKLIKNRIDTLNTDSLPTIVMGDMNVDGSNPIFNVLGMKNSREEAEVTDNVYTYGSKYIDHIFYKGLDVVAYETINGNWEGTNYLSDHKPIMSMFNFPK